MIIDFHTHIFPSFFRNDRGIFFPEEPAFELLYQPSGSRLAGRKEIVEDMDKEGVHKSVIFGFPWKKTDNFRRHNDYIIESVRQHPDRLIGFCCFDPLSRHAALEAERCLESGLSGIGEIAIYDSGFSSEIIAALKDVMDVCSRYDVPILLHTNEPVGHKYPGKQPMLLNQLYDLLKRYPSNRIVLAHWGGGLLFYSLMKKEVQQALANVWFDTAASPYLYVPEIYRVAGEIVGPEKILFGSDYPLLKPSRYFKEMESSGLPSRSMEMISGENAARLLRLTS
ncbi:MAG: amidohydrolase [Deltaproteobacteria bacterium]|nr:amidohydrolase [Deltaproteobacteria bacterium]